VNPDIKNKLIVLAILSFPLLIFIEIGLPYANPSFAQTTQDQNSQKPQQQLKSNFSNSDFYNESRHFPVPSWWPNIEENVHTNFNTNVTLPHIQRDAFINPFSIVIGNCYIGKFVLAAPTSVCRGDEGTPIFVGDLSNLQDGVVIHGLETTVDGKNLDDRRYSVNGDLLLGNDSRFDKAYSVYIGYNTSMAHDSMAHGPAWIGNNTFIGMKSIVFNAKVGNNVAVGISSTITGGVQIPDNKYVPPGSTITNQSQADSLPDRIGSPYEKTNKAVIDVNTHLAQEYQKLGMEKLAQQREDKMEQMMIQVK
jgi:carbonic anhydrase/acetyltransferase-like protein (isoleucine patch superfamily)